MIGQTLASWGRLIGLGKKPPAAADERRIWGRFPCDVQTTCKLTRNRATHGVLARVKNVSMGGAGLFLPEPFALGELFSLHLPSPKDESSDILACVVRCDQIDETTWEVGCTFASPLDSHDLHRFEAPADDRSPSDRRRWERFPCQARAMYQIVRADEGDESRTGAIINISVGGLALQPDHPLEVGELLSVDLYHVEEHVLTALASVVRTHRDESRFVVGCNFICELEEETLARLLG